MAKLKTPDNSKKVADGLSNLLADTFVLYLKTHFYHWNVRGPLFRTLHIMFEEQYNALWTSTDMIAERIRSLDADAPGTFAEYSALASIKEDKKIPKAMDMVKILAEDHAKAVKTAKEAFKAAEAADDEPTQDLLIQRIDYHETTIWMLKTMLE